MLKLNELSTEDVQEILNITTHNKVEDISEAEYDGTIEFYKSKKEFINIGNYKYNQSEVDNFTATLSSGIIVWFE